MRVAQHRPPPPASFDADHGGDLPASRSVKRAQRRLTRWREDLAETCRQDILAGRCITVTGTFVRAGVPANANLRATRLGLVDMVRDAARRQRILTGGETAATAETTMAEYRLLRDLAWAGEWNEIGIAARMRRVTPNASTRPTPRPFDRPWSDPIDGVLDSLFSPAWLLRNRLDPYDVVARVVVHAAHRHDGPSALSRWWRERVEDFRASGSCDMVVSREAYPQKTFVALAPAGRAFILGEWSPPWMPHFSDWERIRPPSASPFGPG